MRENVHSDAQTKHVVNETVVKPRRDGGRALEALTKSSMASFTAEMLSTNTSGITVAIGANDDTAGIS